MDINMLYIAHYAGWAIIITGAVALVVWAVLGARQPSSAVARNAIMARARHELRKRR